MSERTRAPSARRREEARRRGEVAFSPALSASAAFLAGVAVLAATAPLGARRLLGFARRAFSSGAAGDPAALGREAAIALAWLVVPAALAALVASVLSGLLQTRGLLAVRAIGRPSTPPPARGRSGGAGRQALFLAVGALATVAALRREAGAVRALLTPSGTVPLLAAPALLARVGLRVAAALLVAGLLDFALRRWSRERSLRPTRHEARREGREDRVDPRLRAEQRRLRAGG